MINIPSFLNLYSIQLSEVQVKQLSGKTIGIGYNTKADFNLEPFWINQGYQGVHIICNGLTIGNANNYGVTLQVESTAGYVLLEDLSIIAGQHSACFAGTDAFGSSKYRSSSVHFRSVKFYAIHSPKTFGRSKWINMGYQANFIYENCDIFGGEARQHPNYQHGFGKLIINGKILSGCWAKELRVHNSGGECLKLVNRPHKIWYSKNIEIGPGTKYLHSNEGTHYLYNSTMLVVEDCYFQDYGQSWSDFGGAGIVIQGANTHGIIKGSIFKAGAQDPSAPAIAIASHTDNSAEFFDHNGIAAYEDGKDSKSDLSFQISDSFMWMPDGGKSGGPLNPIIRSYDLESMNIKNCGIYCGNHGFIGYDNVNGFSVTDCNTETINLLSKSIFPSIDISYNVPIYGPQSGNVVEGIEYEASNH